VLLPPTTSRVVQVAFVRTHFDDVILQKLGLEDWIALGDVETLKFIREGGLEGLGDGDVQALTQGPPRRFGDFVKDSIKPMVS
jgi:hypothetical protein